MDTAIKKFIGIHLSFIRLGGHYATVMVLAKFQINGFDNGQIKGFARATEIPISLWSDSHGSFGVEWYCSVHC